MKSKTIEKSAHCIGASVSRDVVFRNGFHNEKYNLWKTEVYETRDNTSEKVCRVRSWVPSGVPGANHSGLDITDLINEIQYFMAQTICPDKSFLYNTNHLGEKFYRQDPRWDALSYKPIRDLTEEELKFGCTAVSTNGLVVYRLETERRALLKLVNSLSESLNHGEISNSEMDFIKKGILEGFDSIYQSDEHKDMERNNRNILKDL